MLPTKGTLPSKEEIIEDLQRVYHTVGRLTVPIYKLHRQRHITMYAINRTFYTFTKAMEAAGLESEHRLGDGEYSITADLPDRDTTQRTCLLCDRWFASYGAHNRRCARCAQLLAMANIIDGYEEM